MHYGVRSKNKIMQSNSFKLYGIDFYPDVDGFTWYGSQTNNTYWKINKSAYMESFPWVSTLPNNDLDNIDIRLNRSVKQLKPSLMQENALKFYLENTVKIRKSIKQAIHEDYEKIYDGLELESYETEIHPRDLTDDTDFFSDRLFLRNIIIHPDHLDKISYITFYFESSWDFEHGFNIILHQARVVSTGGVEETIQADIERGPVKHYFGQDTW